MLSAASMPQHITCMLSESGLLWVGTSAGFILTMPLPRLEGVPQVRGRPMVSYHAQTGAVRFLSAVQCNMVPVGTDPGALTPVNEEVTTPLKSSLPSLTDEEPVGRLLHQQPSWVSSPDLSFLNESELEDESVGSISDLYGSLLQGIDSDLDSEVLANSDVVLRQKHNYGVIQSLTINAVSNRVINRLSNVISKGRGHVTRLRTVQPIRKELSTSVTDADSTASPGIYEEPNSRGSFDPQGSLNPQESSHESLNGTPSVLESVNSATESPALFDRGSVANTSYRRLVVPARPSMVTSNLVHVQSSKALMVVCGGTGYKCWNKKLKQADLPSADDCCLLLWKC